ncbi:MAG: ACP S-malonyltransferase [Rickettsiales bacterium]|jgi:[acyl-carrier-protein] S-malonyltransferase|nr:ACP S-malonyltransferase [Rickettsiales bacterium]
MKALLFPGQGSQKLGMGRVLAQNSPIAKAVFDEVDAALGEKLSAVIWGEDESALNATENAQPAILAMSVASYRAAGSPPADFVLGHSLGEYGALVASGAIGLFDGAKLLRARGLAMKAAASGKMMAVLGLAIDRVAEICGRYDSLWVANDNCPGQVVVSGSKEAIEKSAVEFASAGAKRALPLDVSVPAHCPLMLPARVEMEKLLAKSDIKNPEIPFVSNRTARVAPGDEIKSLLAEQMTCGVRFRECVEFLAEQGVSEAFEVGEGAVLSGLVKRSTDRIIAGNLEA